MPKTSYEGKVEAIKSVKNGEASLKGTNGHKEFKERSSAKGEIYMTDATEFKYYVGEETKKLYLSAILDLYDRRIVAYKIGEATTINLFLKPFRRRKNSALLRSRVECTNFICKYFFLSSVYLTGESPIRMSAGLYEVYDTAGRSN